MSSKSFADHSDVWEKNAKSNAKWAVISAPEMLGKTWDDEGFYKSGQTDVDFFLSQAEAAGASLSFKGQALDFGCGVGRLTRGLSTRFAKVLGVDVSAEMIRQATAQNQAQTNCEFVTNAKPDLSFIGDESMDAILSLIVIQHIPPPYSYSYLQEFSRVLKKGGILIVQIPSERNFTLRNLARRLIPESVFRLKHGLLKRDVPYVTMFGMPRELVSAFFQALGLEALSIQKDALAGTDWVSYTYILRRT